MNATMEIDSASLASRERRSDVIDNLTYSNYRWHRSFHGIAAERLAIAFPRWEKYEARYQEELARRAA